MARKSSKATPTVISSTLYTDDAFNGIRVDTPEWSACLDDLASFYYEFPGGSFSARKQPHRQGSFWYAYKRIDGKLKKLYIGGRQTVTDEKLRQTAQRFSDLATKRP